MKKRTILSIGVINLSEMPDMVVLASEVANRKLVLVGLWTICCEKFM